MPENNPRFNPPGWFSLLFRIELLSGRISSRNHRDFPEILCPSPPFQYTHIHTYTQRKGSLKISCNIGWYAFDVQIIIIIIIIMLTTSNTQACIRICRKSCFRYISPATRVSHSHWIVTEYRKRIERIFRWKDVKIINGYNLASWMDWKLQKYRIFEIEIYSSPIIRIILKKIVVKFVVFCILCLWKFV